MKAELCPVCLGKGKIGSGTYGEEKTCHGCGGCGWVSVPEDHPFIPYVEDKEE
jgi:hypothetical protein